ncbi:MAG: hypothetical protein Q9225_002069, partial [Loekoesia sp. 1 TL-2023]
MDSHPQQRFPTLANYDRFSFADDFAREATLADTGERIWILRLGVIERYQGWVLEGPDGFHILVKAQYTRKHGGHVYFPWLGGDLGFSDEIIAHHQLVAKQRYSIRAYARKKDLDPDDVLSEYDISKQDLGSGTSREVVKAVNKKSPEDVDEDSDSSLTSLSSLVPLMNHWKAKNLQPSNKTTGKKRPRNAKLLKGAKAIKIEPEEEIAKITAPEKQHEILFPRLPSSRIQQRTLPQQNSPPRGLPLCAYYHQGRIYKIDGLEFGYNESDKSYEIHHNGANLAKIHPDLRIQTQKLQKIFWALEGKKMRFESSSTMDNNNVDPILDIEMCHEKDVQRLLAMLQESRAVFVKGESQAILERKFKERSERQQKELCDDLMTPSPFAEPTATTNLQTPPSSLGTPFFTPTTRTTSNPNPTTNSPPVNITLHFFLADPSLGAIPHSFPSLTALPSHRRFFTLAIAAYETVPGVKGSGGVVAAS